MCNEDGLNDDDGDDNDHDDDDGDDDDVMMMTMMMMMCSPSPIWTCATVNGMVWRTCPANRSNEDSCERL